MADTKIEWADRVWNPVTGCTKVSEGCRNCYAERIAKRFWGERKFSDVICHRDRLEQPLHWKKPSRVFVDSMADLFHEDVPFSFIREIFGFMHSAKRHTFIVLTKRPGRMMEFIKYFAEWAGFNAWPAEYPHVWLGVSVENQEEADRRIPILLLIPAAKRIVSVEPMLGRIFLNQIHFDDQLMIDALGGKYGWPYPYHEFENNVDLKAWPVDWVICGCESGPGARAIPSIEMVKFLRDQCREENVPFFLKQLMLGGKLVKMPVLDGKVWDQVPDDNQWLKRPLVVR